MKLYNLIFWRNDGLSFSWLTLIFENFQKFLTVIIQENKSDFKAEDFVQKLRQTYNIFIIYFYENFQSILKDNIFLGQFSLFLFLFLNLRCFLLNYKLDRIRSIISHMIWSNPVQILYLAESFEIKSNRIHFLKLMWSDLYFIFGLPTSGLYSLKKDYLYFLHF